MAEASAPEEQLATVTRLDAWRDRYELSRRQQEMRVAWQRLQTAIHQLEITRLEQRANMARIFFMGPVHAWAEARDLPGGGRGIARRYARVQVEGLLSSARMARLGLDVSELEVLRLMGDVDLKELISAYHVTVVLQDKLPGGRAGDPPHDYSRSRRIDQPPASLDDRHHTPQWIQRRVAIMDWASYVAGESIRIATGAPATGLGGAALAGVVGGVPTPGFDPDAA